MKRRQLQVLDTRLCLCVQGPRGGVYDICCHMLVLLLVLLVGVGILEGARA